MWVVPKLESVPLGDRIAFVGPMAAGKTTAANYLVRHHGFVRIALADKLKAIAYELYGVQSKDGNGRRILQELGDACRSFDDDVFTKWTLAYIKNNYQYRRVVIDDVRLPQEAAHLKNNGFVMIGILTPDSVRADRIARLYPALPDDRQGHATERSWQDIPLDTSIRSVDAADLIALDALMVSYAAD